jgi:ABC-type sulfate/molybdate transport systems ATPase subunit
LDARFECGEGELLALVGPSGSGKTTILRAIAGLIRPAAGRVRANGAVWVDDHTFVPPQGRRVGLVFQHYALFPHLTATGNVQAALPPTLPREMRSSIAGELLEFVRLGGLEDRLPRQLSGGQQQRVALARALARDPQVLLLDEPFSAVDAQTRMVLQRELAQTLQRARKTALLITHDLLEAVTLSDRVLVMSKRPGRIIDEIAIELPDRDNPIARRHNSKVGDYVARLMDRLDIGHAVLEDQRATA